MFKYKDPLPENPFCKWTERISGAAGIDAEELARSLGASVVEHMETQCSITVSAQYDDIQTGGLLSKKVQPGILFKFAERSNYCGFLVGLNKVAGILEVAIVQHGSPSAGMQRLNVAESKGAFSVGGALRKAVTDTAAVEEERMYYSALNQTIQDIVESWIE